MLLALRDLLRYKVNNDKSMRISFMRLKSSRRMRAELSSKDDALQRTKVQRFLRVRHEAPFVGEKQRMDCDKAGEKKRKPL